MVDHIVKPLVARGGAGLSAPVLFFSMIGGVLAFGGVGLLVGPGAVSLLVALARAGAQLKRAEKPPRGSSLAKEEHEPSSPQ